MICKIEICNSVIGETRISAENSTSIHEPEKWIGQLTINVHVDRSLLNNSRNSKRKWEVKNLRGELCEISSTFLDNSMRRLGHRAQK